MTESEATAFADQWIAAWNSHDLERILAHYSEDVELTSPMLQAVLGEARTSIRGKDSLRAYFDRALHVFPDLRFVLHGVFAGADSLVVHYQSVRDLRSAELMVLEPGSRVSRVMAHYSARR